MLQSPRRVLFVALGLGVAADALFYGKLPGISALLFTLITFGSLLWLGREEGVAPVRANLWLIAPALFFAAMVAVRANGFLTGLNICAALVFLGLFAFFYRGGRVERVNILGYAAVAFYVIAASLGQAFPLLPALWETVRGSGRGARNMLPLLRGLVLAAPVLLVFTCLLSLADRIFASYLTGFFHIDALKQLPDLAAQIFVVLQAAWLLGGILVLALSQQDDNLRSGFEDPARDLTGRFSIGFVEAATVLVLVNGLFLAFGAIQFAYLFGGAANITAAGFTYADYARRGFFELVAVAVLALLLILGLNAFTWRETREQRLGFNALSSGMVALVLVLLASALRRMMLYEEAYGYTHLRLYVHIFMLWLGVALLWFVFTVWLKPRRFAIGGLIMLIGFLATVNIVNPDATIAEENLARAAQTKQIDLSYLMDLSDDAVPVMARYADATGPARLAMRTELTRRLTRLQSSTNWRDWPSFHLARYEAYRVMMDRQLALIDPVVGN